MTEPMKFCKKCDQGISIDYRFSLCSQCRKKEEKTLYDEIRNLQQMRRGMDSGKLKIDDEIIDRKNMIEDLNHDEAVYQPLGEFLTLEAER